MGGETSQVPSSYLEPTWTRAGSICSFGFTALGTPKPKARPRVVRNAKTGFVQTFTPDDTVNWEQAIGWQVKQALAWIQVHHPGELELPWSGRVMVDMRFNVRRPASLPKKVLFPMKGADIDNLVKCVLDGLQNVNVLTDDKIVTDIDARKRFADPEHPEGVEVEVTAWL
jgi:Holliday junction resolvase RusA-like endonuclease